MSQMAERKLARSFGWIVSALVVGAGLTACGGGGGGGGPVALNAPPSSPASPSSGTTAPIVLPANPVTPDDPALAPAPGSEPMPSLSDPQPGSTAAVSQGNDGVWYGPDLDGHTLLAFVGPTNDLIANGGPNWIWGGLVADGGNWKLTPETVGTDDDSALTPVAGTSLITSKSGMTNSFTFGNGASRHYFLDYGRENALAVDASSMAGTWLADDSEGLGITLTVDAQGMATGTTQGSLIGVCSLSGSITQREPGTQKNQFAVNLQAVNAATGDQLACGLSNKPYAGVAVISLKAAGKYDANGYYRVLAMLVNTADYAWIKQVLKRQR